ncbi:ATP-binding protein [Allokutzneria oryzae]|uniref:ATP-binding protein n=1 Tax=Allokutzneria oryzae TaxID=1378989 RepID=A0ABV6A5E3_9PSEU
MTPRGGQVVLGSRHERAAPTRDGFVGRARELAVFERALTGGLDRNVLFVHGPGGVGKTSLLRTMFRRAQRLGTCRRSRTCARRWRATTWRQSWRPVSPLWTERSRCAPRCARRRARPSAPPNARHSCARSWRAGTSSPHSSTRR